MVSDQNELRKLWESASDEKIIEALYVYPSEYSEEAIEAMKAIAAERGLQSSEAFLTAQSRKDQDVVLALDPKRRAVKIEVAVVLILGLMSPLLALLSTWVNKSPSPTDPNSPFRFFASMMQQLQVIIPVLYIMWRSGDSWSTFGFKPFRLVRDGLTARRDAIIS